MAAAKEPDERHRRWPRWLPSPKLLVGFVALVAVVVVVLQAHSAEKDVVDAFRHFRVDRLPWLALAIGIESLSFLCYAEVQRRLLAEGGAHLHLRSMVALAVGATGMTNLVPGGTAPASGWLVAQYRRRDVPMPVALWSVIAGGYLAGVSILVLLLVGAAVAGLLPLWAVVVCAVALVGGAVLLVVLARQIDVVERWLGRYRAGRVAGLAHRGATQLTLASEFRTSRNAGIEVIVLSLANWVFDVGCLIAAFSLLDLPIPWRNALFAYAVAQVAGSLAPVPGGIGFVEGGMVGAFALTGTPAGNAFAATIIYRFVTTWLVAAIGSVMLVILSRSTARPARLEASQHSRLPRRHIGEGVGTGARDHASEGEGSEARDHGGEPPHGAQVDGAADHDRTNSRDHTEPDHTEPDHLNEPDHAEPDHLNRPDHAKRAGGSGSTASGAP